MGRTMLIVKANGGTVTVEKKAGESWVVTDTFARDGGYLLELGSSYTRITPIAGAFFEVTR
ncbi:Phosphoribosyl 1,2-cyclic phosphodiesterase [Pseudomonas syringae pv. actinidiae]|nr:Phosphoribosyl 1,2-cyclic phosphodiesterase [Pseudomonas syringae pv. actinidiae]